MFPIPGCRAFFYRTILVVETLEPRVDLKRQNFDLELGTPILVSLLPTVLEGLEHMPTVDSEPVDFLTVADDR